MATLDNLEVSYNRRVQMDQFEPIELGAVGEVTLEPDDDPDVVYDQTQRVVQQMVERGLVERIARARRDEVGRSLSEMEAVIREEAGDVLDDETIGALAARVIE